MAATLGNYFIDGPTLLTSTAVYDDVNLTVCAADGFYSDGTYVRQQFNCVLLPAILCPSCDTDCNSIINAGGSTGLYNLSFATGNVLGAMIIYFRAQSVPDGFRAVYDGVTYNELTSPSFGYLASATNGNYTVTGQSSSDCTPSIASTLNGGGYSNLAQYQYNPSTSSFDLTGNSGVVTGAGTDVVLTAGPPGYCTMVIPRINNNANTCLLEIVGFCGTAWDLEINCPTPLTSTPISLQGLDCTDIFDTIFYVAPNRGGTAGEPAINEFPFADANGAIQYPAGTYTINPPSAKKQIVIDANGVITSIINCP